MALCLAPPKFWRVRSAESEKGPKQEQPALKT
jgi:hypothetical protein